MIRDNRREGIRQEDTPQEDILVVGTPVVGNPVGEGMPQKVEGTVQEDIVPEDIQDIHVHGARKALCPVRHVYPSHHPCSPFS